MGVLLMNHQVGGGLSLQRGIGQSATGASEAWQPELWGCQSGQWGRVERLVHDVRFHLIPLFLVRHASDLVWA